MKAKISFKIIELSEESYHPMMKININGKSARVIVDTGASHSAFDLTKLEKYVDHKNFRKNDEKTTGLGTNTMESHMVTLKKVVIGELKITDYNAIILDMSHVNETYTKMKMPHIDGVLGSDILVKYKAVINYEEKTIVFKFKKPKK